MKANHNQHTSLSLKKQLFYLFHIPDVKWYNLLYQITVLLAIFADCFIINVILFDFNAKSHQKQVKLIKLMKNFDIVLLAFLMIEQVLRIYSLSGIKEYLGFRGMYRYLQSYIFGRLIDISSIVLLIWFIILPISLDIKMLTTFRILHLFLLLQFYRIFAKIYQDLLFVLMDNLNMLALSFSLFMVLLILLSYSVYFIELCTREESFNSTAESAWFGFITLTTIGYGDVIIKSPTSKVVTTIMVLIAFCLFNSPATLIGSDLATRLHETRTHQRFTLAPAIQVVQKCCLYRSDRSKLEDNLDQVNKRRLCRVFLYKIALHATLDRFRFFDLVYRTGNVPLQTAIAQRQIELIYSRLKGRECELQVINKQLSEFCSWFESRKLETQQPTH